MAPLLIIGFVVLVAICAAIQFAYGSYRDRQAGLGERLPSAFERPPDESDLL